jgi:membrane protease YdiL (CAAX protease family)
VKNPYLAKTGGILYSYLICLPLLLLYELLIRISQPGEDQIVRISVDVWFKTVFQLLGVNAVSATFLAAALAGGFIVYQKRHELSRLKKHYFGLMMLESLIYALLVGTLIGSFLGSLLHLSAESPLQSLSRLQLIALSLGAGLYEELFFRVILVTLFLYIFKPYYTGKYTAYIIAAVCAALIFSSVHYIGEYGDPFALNSFVFRFLFGLALNVIYVTRGFGIAAWTHAIYDIIVIMMI